MTMLKPSVPTKLTDRTGSSDVLFVLYVMRFPDDRLTVLVLTNRRGPDAMPLAEAVANLFLP